MGAAVIARSSLRTRFISPLRFPAAPSSIQQTSSTPSSSSIGSHGRECFYTVRVERRSCCCWGKKCGKKRESGNAMAKAKHTIKPSSLKGQAAGTLRKVPPAWLAFLAHPVSHPTCSSSSSFQFALGIISPAAANAVSRLECSVEVGEECGGMSEIWSIFFLAPSSLVPPRSKSAAAH